MYLAPLTTKRKPAGGRRVPQGAHRTLSEKAPDKSDIQNTCRKHYKERVIRLSGIRLGRSSIIVPQADKNRNIKLILIFFISSYYIANPAHSQPPE